MKKIFPLGIVIAAILAAVVTCPDKKAHQDAVMEKMNSTISTTIKDKAGLGDNSLSNGLAKLTSALASNILKPAFEQSLTVDNYFVYSIGKIGLGDDKKTVSIGVFGHVFTTFDENDL